MIGIYFYKNIIGKNKYICTTSVKGPQAVDSLFGLDVLDLKKKVPKLNLGTYLIIDGTVFTL
ncbi:hypothetical protein [Leuconostoc mesenteroides]